MHPAITNSCFYSSVFQLLSVELQYDEVHELSQKLSDMIVYQVICYFITWLAILPACNIIFLTAYSLSQGYAKNKILRSLVVTPLRTRWKARRSPNSSGLKEQAFIFHSHKVPLQVWEALGWLASKSQLSLAPSQALLASKSVLERWASEVKFSHQGVTHTSLDTKPRRLILISKAWRIKYQRMSASEINCSHFILIITNKRAVIWIDFLSSCLLSK